jgi:hypothetical protein
MPSLPDYTPHYSLVHAAGSLAEARVVDALADMPGLVFRMQDAHKVTGDLCLFGAPRPDRERCHLRHLADLAAREVRRRESRDRLRLAGYAEAMAAAAEIPAPRQAPEQLDEPTVTPSSPAVLKVV